MELTILMPCLNEAKTVEHCVKQALSYLQSAGIVGEVLVSDNGSTDGSQELAIAAGARVVSVSKKGYGCALNAGISAARGKFIIMGDADQSYDFSRLEGFVAKLREGHQLVMGDRFAGGIQQGAMPVLHRYLGNPVLSFIGRLFFGAQVRDFHCGLRGFHRESILKLGLAAAGMEFASEMVVKATLAELSIANVPTSLAPDGRGRPPHLRTWRDGWRHLRFLLLYSPRWLFFYPGLTLSLAGTLLQLILAFGPLHIGNFGLDVHTMLFASAFSVMGVQMIWMAVISRWIGFSSGVMSQKAAIERIFAAVTLERGLLVGGMFCALAIVLAGIAFRGWELSGFGAVNVQSTMRLVIPSVTLLLTGGEIMVGAFLLSSIKLYRSGTFEPSS
jgi:glycosyltransferase involved in cell wall biosynthesis